MTLVYTGTAENNYQVIGKYNIYHLQSYAEAYIMHDFPS